MKEQAFLNLKYIELKRLLEKVKDDPILAPQLEDRVQEIEDQLSNLPPFPIQAVELPRTAIFFRGGGVIDSDGIRPSLAGEALIQYEKMFIEQSLYDEREVAKDAGKTRRPKGQPKPELLFTGTPRGSFGLEFIPMEVDDAALQASRAKSLENVTTAIVNVVRADEGSIDTVISSIPTTVLSPMKTFMKTVSKYGAELRLVYQNKPSLIFSTSDIFNAYEKLDREIVEEEITVKGTFKGLTLQSGHFDILTEDSELITGTISEDMPEGERLIVARLLDQPCTLIVRRTTIKATSGLSSVNYLLLKADLKL